jgi:hypothetical protein
VGVGTGGVSLRGARWTTGKADGAAGGVAALEDAPGRTGAAGAEGVDAAGCAAGPLATARWITGPRAAGPDDEPCVGGFGTLMFGVAERCTGAARWSPGGIAGCCCAPGGRDRTARIGGACFVIGASPSTG